MTEELCHVKCITCGRVIGNKWDRYMELLSEGVEIGEALNQLGLFSYCCRMRMMGPAKIPTRMVPQTDPVYESRPETLTIATGDRAPVLAPLEAMQQPSMSYTVVPTAMIALPGIPEIALPPIPAPGAEAAPVSENVKKIIRSYTAW